MVLSLLPAALTAAMLLLVVGHSRAQSVPDTARPPRPEDISQLTFVKTAADCAHPFGLREGQNLEYRLLDGKGKTTGTWRYRVLKISTETSTPKKSAPVETTKVLLKSGLYSPTNRLIAQQDLTYSCRHDTTFTDGLGYINYGSLKSFRDRRLAYQGTPLAWPHQPAAGSRLADGGVVVQVSSPSVAIAKVQTTLRQRKVLAGGPVSVTVPAGTFNCYAVESQREVSTAARADLVLKSSGREIDYYDPAVGIIKTETYDKGGKLVQSRVLSKR
jgi:hypothetical protein